MGDVCPLPCLYSATSVLGPCSGGGCAASPMIPPVAWAFCLCKMLGLDMDAHLGRVHEANESSSPDPSFELVNA